MEAVATGESPLVKAKGYFKALQRSFSSSALERSFSLDEEDPGVMTIDFLWSRLQAQRARYRAEKQRADMLARKVWELEQKLRARDNTPSKHVEFMPEYELEEKVRNHDERLVGMMMAHDVENQKSCKCVACDNSNSPYPIPRSPNHGKKIRIPPSFSAYACHRRSYVDSDIESRFSPRQGQQMGMLSHEAFHDPQILHMLQHGGSVQEKALQGRRIWDQAQEVVPSVKLEHEDGYGGFSQCHLGMNKLSIVAPDQLRPSTKLHHTSKQFASCPNITVGYAKNVTPEAFYADANDAKLHAAVKKGGRGSLERQSARRQQQCPHCSAVSTLVTSNISSTSGSQHPQRKTALNRCVSYDTLSLNTKECLRALDIGKEHNHQRPSKGSSVPAYCDRHATRLKLLQGDDSPLSTSL